MAYFTSISVVIARYIFGYSPAVRSSRCASTLSGTTTRSTWRSNTARSFGGSPRSTRCTALVATRAPSLLAHRHPRQLECSSKCQPRARAAIGIEPLQLVIVHDTKRDTAHAVVAVRLDERWLTLDNRMLVMVNTIETGCYPLFVLDGVCGSLAPRPFTAEKELLFHLHNSR